MYRLAIMHSVTDRRTISMLPIAADHTACSVIGWKSNWRRRASSAAARA